MTRLRTFAVASASRASKAATASCASEIRSDDAERDAAGDIKHLEAVNAAGHYACTAQMPIRRDLTAQVTTAETLAYLIF
jgi:hypothetical protein